MMADNKEIVRKARLARVRLRRTAATASCTTTRRWSMDQDQHWRDDGSAKMDPAGSARTATFIAIIPALLEPDDIANLALFLAADKSRSINGAIIPADAGWRAA